MITAPNGRPALLRQKIARVMSDGRERTTNDVVLATGGKTKSDTTSTRRALSDMAAMGLIARDGLDGVALWRATQ